MLKKITSAIAALATVATMGATALSASAACVHNPDASCYGEGTFYQWVDTNGNNSYDAGEETTPYHMLDGLIDGNPEYNPYTGEITVTLQDMVVSGYTGCISAVHYYKGAAVDITSGDWVLTPDTGYTVSIEVNGYPHPDKDIVFKVTTPCSGGCGCGCN